jgi:hypothetical protein
MNDDRPSVPERELKPAAREARREPLVPDPVKEQVGAHSAAGAVSGQVFGPLGSLAGAIGGAAAGSAAGLATGGSSGEPDFDPTPFEGFWREHFASRPYAQGDSYERFEPAYRFGIVSYAETDHPMSWEEVARPLQARWESHPASSSLPWRVARDAIRDAWDRMRDPQGWASSVHRGSSLG